MSDAASPARGNSRRFALCAILVALIQSAALIWMIYDRVSLIESGREIVLDTVPVDPRSLFRGDYVILNYAISGLDASTPGGNGKFRRGEPVYVTLEKPEEGGWRAAAVSGSFPEKTGTDEIVIRGRVTYGGGSNIRIKYGIESYFVPEGEGRELEQLVRDSKLQVLVAVANDGEAAIKGLLIDGEMRYEEPLF